MNPKQALGLPPGSVRALLAFIVVLATVTAFFLRGQVPETLSTMAGMVLVFYFQRQRSERQE